MQLLVVSCDNKGPYASYKSLTNACCTVAMTKCRQRTHITDVESKDPKLIIHVTHQDANTPQNVNERFRVMNAKLPGRMKQWMSNLSTYLLMPWCTYTRNKT